MMPKSPRGSRELPDALSQGHSVAEMKLRHTSDGATLGHDQDAKWPRERERETAEQGYSEKRSRWCLCLENSVFSPGPWKQSTAVGFHLATGLPHLP